MSQPDDPRAALEAEIARILSPAINAKAPYAKVMIGMLADLLASSEPTADGQSLTTKEVMREGVLPKPTEKTSVPRRWSNSPSQEELADSWCPHCGQVGGHNAGCEYEKFSKLAAVPRPPSERLLKLANQAAINNHHYWMTHSHEFSEHPHRDPFDECPHPDCTLVRASSPSSAEAVPPPQKPICCTRMAPCSDACVDDWIAREKWEAEAVAVLSPPQNNDQKEEEATRMVSPTTSEDARTAASVAPDAINYDELDPGISGVVRKLREAGFHTTDSGDGITKLKAGWSRDEALDTPHVFAVVDESKMRFEAHRMQAVLGSKWRVEASYVPVDGASVLMAWGQSANTARVRQVADWQSIDTAPKDGTTVWLYPQMVPGQFHQTERMWWRSGAWIEPTHWMPLPALPVTSEGNQPPSGLREDPVARSTSAAPHAPDPSSESSSSSVILAPSSDLRACKWAIDDVGGDSVWETQCGHAFTFNEDGPRENQIGFCGYCGGKLIEVRTSTVAALDPGAAR